MSDDMIHIVLFKFDLEKLAAEFPGDELQKAAKHLEKVVPGLINISLTPRRLPKGGNANNNSGYNYILISRHDDLAALKVYADHIDHKAFQDRIRKCFLAPPLRVDININAKL
ncbi:unnamed protein product [Phytomonas sp. EM1]|nr:unnamed protein product [Phytomonas sp. EM1]|eukprot:CCW60995.1 unnamed protein product [Phytomonas sp. isolate EM1]